MARLTDFLMTTGNKTWTEELLLASQSVLQFNGTALAGFQLTFQDAADILMLTLLQDAGLAFLFDAGPTLNCTQCVTLAPGQAAVPLPATPTLLLAAALTFAGMRRRRSLLILSR
jgi:hypothetical protein